MKWLCRRLSKISAKPDETWDATAASAPEWNLSKEPIGHLPETVFSQRPLRTRDSQVLDTFKSRTTTSLYPYTIEPPYIEWYARWCMRLGQDNLASPTRLQMIDLTMHRTKLSNLLPCL